MLRGIRNGVKPVAASIKEEARDTLPKGGGLNEWVAASKMSPRTRLTGKSAGVRIVTRKAGHDIEAINRGSVRHPVFGNRSAWSDQSVAPGFVDNGGMKKAPEAARAIDVVMHEVAAKIAASVYGV